MGTARLSSGASSANTVQPPTLVVMLPASKRSACLFLCTHCPGGTLYLAFKLCCCEPERPSCLGGRPLDSLPVSGLQATP